MTNLLRVAFVAAALLLAGCDADQKAISRDDFAEVDFDPAVTITLNADGFSPDAVTVDSGSTIELVVAEVANGAVEATDIFTTGRLEPGESTLIILDEPGTYEVDDIQGNGHRLTIEIVETPDEG